MELVGIEPPQWIENIQLDDSTMFSRFDILDSRSYNGDLLCSAEIQFGFDSPTLSVLYCFFMIAHDRRRYNATAYPNRSLIAQQLCEAFPF